MRGLAQTPITELKGVGSKVAEKLSKLGLMTVQDVLFHLPHRYEDRTRVYPIAQLQPHLHTSIEGEVMSSDIQFGRKRMLVVRLSDGSGTVTLRFFHFSAAQKNNFEIGKQLRCFGEVRAGKYGLEIMHPEYTVINPDKPSQMAESLTPVYPATEGVKQLTLRNLSEQALELLAQGGLAELLPEGMYQQQVSLVDALNLVHRPSPDVTLTLLEQGKHPAQQRLVMEELLAHHLSVLKVRHKNAQDPGFVIKPATALLNGLSASLPFELTGAQQRVIQDIHRDILQNRPMMRLIQGDVGSGK
ncbi:MAG: ATP-dependent DNA helicase RecG, partial [Paraglaciecola sp.]